MDALTKSIGKIPASKAVTLFMTGTGQYSIQQTRTITSTGQVNTLGGHTKAAGGTIPGTGHGDDVPGEADPRRAGGPGGHGQAGEVDHLRGRLPGFASGGLVQQGSAGVLNGTAPGTDYSNFQTSVTNSLVSAMRASIKAAAAAAAAAASAASGAYLGAGSANYAADISAVLKAFGLPACLLVNWLRQIQLQKAAAQLEAVNRYRFQRCCRPSVGLGLLQIIPGTFAAYAGPYRNTPPLVNYGGGTVSENPMAQIYAAINYARHAYTADMAGVIGQGHGYALGGLVADTGTTLAPGWNMRYNGTGRPERLAPGSSGHATTPGHAPPLSPDALAILDRLDRLTAVTGQQGGQFAGAISGAAGGAALRGSYSTRR